ncbi:mitochondrial K+-H+ exchange-related-domain-containing protein [Mycena crocata]|nr:mitochondrial K+-H+ exchange-related-domain-containing protein [Mycena crocata]
MRIVSLPLTRPHPPQRIITYYSFTIVPPPPPPQPPSKDPPASGWLPQEGVVKWATFKVDATWADWGKAETGWRHRVFEFGERFLDKLDFEEAALKRINVHVAPPSKVPDDLSGEARTEVEAELAKLKVPLYYPPSVSSAPEAVANLNALLQERIPLHNRGFYKFLFLAPLTAPFMIIPVIPNLPFFFCAWRAWSHYQALRAARHVDALLQNGKIVPEADKTLDAAYETAVTTAGASDTKPEPDSTKQTLIVTRDSLGNAMRTLEMKPDEAKDVLRAYEQAVNRLRP